MMDSIGTQPISASRAPRVDARCSVDLSCLAAARFIARSRAARASHQHPPTARCHPCDLLSRIFTCSNRRRPTGPRQITRSQSQLHRHHQRRLSELRHRLSNRAIEANSNSYHPPGHPRWADELFTAVRSKAQAVKTSSTTRASKCNTTRPSSRSTSKTNTR